jgi:hypothetical protein
LLPLVWSKGVQFSITTRDATVVLSRIDLYNESGNKFGSAECKQTKSPLQVFVSLDAQTFHEWVNAGTVNPGRADNGRTLYLWVYLTFKGSGEEVYRTMTLPALYKSQPRQIRFTGCTEKFRCGALLLLNNSAADPNAAR